MIYYRCPTCKTLLANKQLIFEKDIKKICGDTKLNEQDKNEQKKKLLDRLELTRYCCRMKMLTYVDQIKIVK